MNVSQINTKIREIDAVDIESVYDFVSATSTPVVFRGLVSRWPLVEKSRLSSAALRGYLLDFYKGAEVPAFVSEANIGGRIFYTDKLAELNINRIKTKFDWVLEQIREREDDSDAPTVYMGSVPLDYCLPGLREQNHLPLGEMRATVRIWIGNRTTVAPHYDVLDNIACVCAGRRKFTLFPPEQLPNLYVGPIDFTPAGQAISLVDLDNPDFDRYPRFATALENAQSTLLEPGDAIYIPSMWWHHVQGLEGFNILVNHWWRESPAYAGPPGDVLFHAILNIRPLPEDQRKAWQVLFNHYIFEPGSETVEHIPVEKRGVLGKVDDETARKIRAELRNKMRR